VVLISDFGLGKKLADGQSSFHHTFGAGTAGWVAAECLEVRHMNSLKPVKITKAIDIFAAGCVFYYVLTNGKHPYGEMLTREHNIVKGNYRLRDLSDQNQDHILAKDLIKQMIPRHYQKRLSARNVQNHPYFWKSARKLDFLQAISDRLEVEIGKPQGSIIMGRIERNKESVIGDNWTIKLDEQVLEDMKKYRNYDSSSICHLLRLLRNKVLLPNQEASLLSLACKCQKRHGHLFARVLGILEQFVSRAFPPCI
jgi:serine/threonine protein kinase